MVPSGARLRRRKSSPRQEPALVERDPKIRLSKQFREVLQDIYDRVDLDNSGSLSRAEFNLFNWRTSGEEVADEEWQVGEQNFRGNLYEQDFFLGGRAELPPPQQRAHSRRVPHSPPDGGRGQPGRPQGTTGYCTGAHLRLLSQLLLSCSIFRQWVTIGL